MEEFLIVIIEGLTALAVTLLAWRCRRSGPLVLVFYGVLLGMVWCAFLHGFCFGVLRVEGPHAEGNARLLAGFGLVAAIFAGIPLGTVLGIAFGIASGLRARRRAIRFRKWVDEGPG